MSPTLYRFLTSVATPLLPLWLRRRARAGKEDAARLGERLGHASAERPPGELIWLHGASVGETQMLRPLTDRLLEVPGRHVLLTSGTVTSAQLMAQQLPARAIHQYLPADTPRATARFLAHWHPDLGVLAESEIWPNLVWTAARADVPLALVNARMSERSLEGWARRPRLARRVFEPFRTLLAADRRTADGLAAIIGRDVPCVGSLKDDAPALSCDMEEARRLEAGFDSRPAWLAASTHEAEEAVFHRLREALPHAAMIWLPRHPERGAAIAEASGLPLRSRGEPPGPQGYVMDTLGEMGLALAMADVCVMGGSFDASLAGHNPLEAARAGVPVLTGPHVQSFSALYEAMDEAGAVMVVRADQAADAIDDALHDRLSGMAARASEFAASRSGALDRTVAALEALL